MAEYHEWIDWIIFTIALGSVGWIAGTARGKARIALVALDILILSIYGSIHLA